MSTPASAVFRQAAEPAQSTPLPQGTNPDKVLEGATDTPISFYEEVNGKPYSANYFEMGNAWNDHDSWREDLSAIDSYYRSKVASGEYEDGKQSFEVMVKEAEKATDTKHASTNLKVAKIAEFVRFMQRMDKIEAERDKWA